MSLKVASEISEEESVGLRPVCKNSNAKPEYTIKVCGDSEDEKESLNKLSFILGFMAGAGIITLANVISGIS